MRLAWLFLALVTWLPAQEGVDIVLAPRHEAATSAVRLGDIASGIPEGAWGDRLRLAPLFDLDDLQPRIVGEREVLAACARLAGGVQLHIQGRSAIQRRARVVSAEEQERVIRKTCTDGELSILKAGQPLTVPDDPALVVTAEPLVAAKSGDVPYRILATIGGREWARGLVTARIVRWGMAVVATRDLPRGILVGLTDVTLVQRQLGRGEPSWLNDPALVVGCLTTQAIRQGLPVTPQLVMSPPVVRSRDPVQLMIEGAGFTVSSPGIALADGRLGECIGARRDGDGTVLRGRILGPGKLVIVK